VPPVNDALVLGLGNERGALPVIRLLVGAVASRVELSLEQIDELQIAIETVLASRVAPGAEVSLALEPRDGELEVRLRPLLDAERELDGLPVERILAKLVEVAEPVTLAGEQWLRLVKRSASTAPGAR
jgi:hypothetical protein